MSSDHMDALLSEVAERDPYLVILLADLGSTIAESLGDSEETWEGAYQIAHFISMSFMEHFGSDLLRSKRQPPKPEQVMSFAYVMATVLAMTKDGPRS